MFPELLDAAGFAGQGVCLIGLDTMLPVFLLDGTGEGGAVTQAPLSAALAARAAVPQAAATAFMIFDALARATGTMLLAGALSLGEIRTSTDEHLPAFHNAVLVCL